MCGHLVYRCPRDPRLFVKKRTTAGWTVNFGHKRSVTVFIFMLVTMFAPFTILFWRSDWPGTMLALGLAILVVIIVDRWKAFDNIICK